MQPLRRATKTRPAPAEAILATLPGVMQFLRREMRRRRQFDLTVPQFRALIYVHHHPDARLSAVAEHVGLSDAAASRMVGHLVNRKLMVRREGRGDRRAVALGLTAKGRAAFDAAYEGTRAAVAEKLARLSTDERETIAVAMQLMHDLFGDNGQVGPGRGNAT
jgi:DNA-binding MarR family transcriptional regulator